MLVWFLFIFLPLLYAKVQSLGCLGCGFKKYVEVCANGIGVVEGVFRKVCKCELNLGNLWHCFYNLPVLEFFLQFNGVGITLILALIGFRDNVGKEKKLRSKFGPNCQNSV